MTCLTRSLTGWPWLNLSHMICGLDMALLYGSSGQLVLLIFLISEPSSNKEEDKFFFLPVLPGSTIIFLVTRQNRTVGLRCRLAHRCQACISTGDYSPSLLCGLIHPWRWSCACPVGCTASQTWHFCSSLSLCLLRVKWLKRLPLLAGP